MSQALATLMDALARGVLLPADPALLDVAAKMGISVAEALQLLAKLVPLRSRNLLLHSAGAISAEMR